MRELPEIPPVTGAWQPTVPVGSRQSTYFGALGLGGGGCLPTLRMAYETFGESNAARSNAILIDHALIGDSHASGSVGSGHSSAGWRCEVVGLGRAMNTDRRSMVCPNVLDGCQGSMGSVTLTPNGRAWGSNFPSVTIRDQVTVEKLPMGTLGITHWHAMIGRSLGGRCTLEWAVSYPEAMSKVVAVATGASTTAEQVAWYYAQMHVLGLDPNFCSGDYYDNLPGYGLLRGLALARKIAHITYRSPREPQERLGRDPGYQEGPLSGGRLAVQPYLDHHGIKLTKYFDAGSYQVLIRTMLTHDVGRGCGGLAVASSQVTAEALALEVDTDRLFYPVQTHQIAKSTPHSHAVIIYSNSGHDGFLIESGPVGIAIADFLA